MAAWLKRWLERAGLLRPAFWVMSRFRSLRLASHSADLKSDLVDGLPMPPASLLVGIGGATTPEAYLDGGLKIAAEVRRVLALHGVALERVGSVLDFGCGCGRVIRRFVDLAPLIDLHGTDYDPRQIAWCRAHLPFAQFGVNRLAPPLPYSQDSFGVVYAFSVFTHLSAELQVGWMNELRRVVKPGGYAVVTVHSEGARDALSTDELERFSRGELVVRYQSVAGSNLCAAFHPRQYIEGHLATGWDLLGITESEVGQTFVLLRKAEGLGATLHS